MKPKDFDLLLNFRQTPSTYKCGPMNIYYRFRYDFFGFDALFWFFGFDTTGFSIF